MNAYHKYQFSLLIVVILFGSVVLGCQNKIQEKPNVLFITVDDLNDLDGVSLLPLLKDPSSEWDNLAGYVLFNLFTKFLIKQ